MFVYLQPPLHNVGLVNQLSQNTWQTPPQQQMAYPGVRPMSNLYRQSPAQLPMQTSQQLIGAMRPMGSMSQQQPLAAAAGANNCGMAAQPSQPSGGEPKKKTNDLLDFDVFSEFHTPTMMTKTATTTAGPHNNNKKEMTDKVDGASQSALNNMLDLSVEPSVPFSSSGSGVSVLRPTSSNADTNTDSLLDISSPPPSTVQHQPPKFNTAMPLIQPKSQQQQPPKVPVSPSVSSPLAHQENYTVPLEALQPGMMIFFGFKCFFFT